MERHARRRAPGDGKVRVRPRTPDAWHKLALVALRRRDFEGALRCVDRALELAPDDPLMLCNRGVILRGAGRLDEAEAAYRRILVKEPLSAEAWYNLGNLVAGKGDRAQALTCYERSLQARPHFVEALNAVGAVLARQGQHTRALEFFKRATGVQDSATLQVNIGSVHVAARRPDDALAAFRRAVKLDPRHVGARLHLARALLARHQFRPAATLLRRLAAERRDDLAVHLLWGHALERCREHRQAISVFRRALALDASSLQAHVMLGQLLTHQPGQVALGLRHLRRALELHPGNLEAKAGLAQALVVDGKLEEAERLLREVLAEAPEHAGVHRQLLHLKKSATGTAAGGAADVAQLEAQLADPATPQAKRCDLEYGLASAYDDAGDYDRAFEHLVRANHLDAVEHPYDMRAVRAVHQRNCATFTKEFFAERATFGVPSELPLFIVGMPRSGTTLTEQILASHPAVFGAGELRHIGELRTKVSALAGSRRAYPASCIDLTRTQVARLARDHVSYLQGLAPTAARVTDKMPFNFNSLGTIALLFPKARIIYCKRNPLDTCLSCYFLRFMEHMSFTNDLPLLGEFYRLHELTMAHWKTVLPVPILEVSYEDLVADQEGQSRRLVEFCGLPWDDRCLRFYETERPIQTASNWQVRQPMYQSSAGRWRNYRSHLGPLIAALGLTDDDLARS